jgi:hypothetical protein
MQTPTRYAEHPEQATTTAYGSAKAHRGFICGTQSVQLGSFTDCVPSAMMISEYKSFWLSGGYSGCTTLVDIELELTGIL